MSEPRTIAVVGATGAQGGGLVRAILADPARAFRARALTRNTGSPAANALAAAGAEVVAANIDDAASVASAFAGADAAFCMTNYWEHFSPERELAQARAMAEGAKAAGVRHLVWSTLEDTRRRVPLDDDRLPTLMGRYKVPHFDAKGEADAIFLATGIPTTLLLTSFYWDNFVKFGMGPKPGPDGALAIVFPMGNTKLPGIAADDIGPCAYGLFKRGGEFAGRTVGISGEHLTGGEMAAAMSRALGREIRYTDVPPEVYRAFGFPGADDLGNMFQYKRDFNAEFCEARDIAFSRSLNPGLQSFAAWLERNKGAIQLG